MNTTITVTPENLDTLTSFPSAIAHLQAIATPGGSNFQSLDTAQSYLQAAFPHWFIYRGGNHVALHYSATEPRVLLIEERRVNDALQAILDGSADNLTTARDQRIAAYLATLPREERRYAAAYAHQLAEVGIENAYAALNQTGHLFDLGRGDRIRIRQAVNRASLTPKPEPPQTPPPAAPEAAGTTNDAAPLPRIVASLGDGARGFYALGRWTPEPYAAQLAEEVETINFHVLTDLQALRRVLKTKYKLFAEAGPGYLHLSRYPNGSPVLVCTQPLTTAQAGVEPGDGLTIFVNQGTRDAEVLAVLDDQYLVEYTMPKGSTSLQVFRVGDNHGRSVSYFTITAKWLQALVDGGREWVANPQSGNVRPVPSPAAQLAAKGQRKAVR